MPVLRVLVAACALLAALPAAAQTVPRSPAQIKLSFAPVVKQVAPAVVNIYTRRVVQSQSTLMSDPMLRQLLGQMGVPRERVERSLGSGVLVRSDGIVVTNNHVVANADQITVVLADRREFEATLVGADDQTDIAVLRIDAHGERLPTLPLGDSDSLEVGDIVLAIGDPFGVGQTVTMGIVSALGRTRVGLSDYRDFIQTDAAINPGNSGGALVDLDGKLVGINSEIYSASGGSVGIGFAIPVSIVAPAMAALAANGRLVRPWLGASGQVVTAAMYEALGLPHPEGVLIASLVAGGPAASAGLRVGDVITEINGQALDDPDALRFRLGTLAVGGTAHLEVMRQGVEQGVDLRLVAPPDDPPRRETLVAGENPLAGATVANLNPALEEELGTGLPDRGVVVTGVAPGTYAARLSLQRGDTVVAVNDQPVASIDELMPLLAVASDRWKLTLRRNGRTLAITITP